MSVEPCGMVGTVLKEKKAHLCALAGGAHGGAFSEPGIRILGLPLIPGAERDLLQFSKDAFKDLGPFEVLLTAPYFNPKRGIIGVDCVLDESSEYRLKSLKRNLLRRFPEAHRYIRLKDGFQIILVKNLFNDMFDYLKSGFSWNKELVFTANEVAISRQVLDSEHRKWKTIKLV